MPDSAPANEYRHEGGGYETTDVSAPGLLIFIICFAVIMGIMGIWLWWLMGRMDGAAIKAERDQTAVPVVAMPQPPLQPSPWHNTLPQEDLAAMRQQAQHTLTSYGWVDRAHNVGRIPIDRAMDILLQRGLPVATQPAASQPKGGGS